MIDNANRDFKKKKKTFITYKKDIINQIIFIHGWISKGNQTRARS